MEQEFGLKELENVTLKATYPIEVNGTTFEVGETVAAFDKIQIANFQEIRKVVTAHGGYDDRARVWWETTKQLSLDFTQGIFSKNQFALLTNSKLIRVDDSTKCLWLNNREELEIDENGQIELEFNPVGKIFVYKKSTYSKLVFDLEGNILTFDPSLAYTDVIVDYEYEYLNSFSILEVGRQLTNGYLELQGKTRVKDDITGQVKTGILYIPKLKLMSGLSMRLGKDAIPVVGRMQAIAVPDGERKNSIVMDLVFLDDDIDSDM